MDFLEECQHYFGTKNLYEILSIEKDANNNEIKSAYRKKSLKVHPDRASEERKEHAKQSFQVLAKVHYILTSENLRNVYDETGIIILNEDNDFASFSTYEEYQNYWRTLFPKLTVKKIDEYLAKYTDSEEEFSDLKALYLRFEGDLDKIYEYHLSYDEERIVRLLNQMIADDEVPSFDLFCRESKANKQKRLKRIEKEYIQAEKEEKKKSKKATANTDAEDISSLQLAIQNKNRGNFDDLISSLEAKYSNGNKKKGGSKSKKMREK